MGVITATEREAVASGVDFNDIAVLCNSDIPLEGVTFARPAHATRRKHIGRRCPHANEHCPCCPIPLSSTSRRPELARTALYVILSEPCAGTAGGTSPLAPGANPAVLGNMSLLPTLIAGGPRLLAFVSMVTMLATVIAAATLRLTRRPMRTRASAPSIRVFARVVLLRHLHINLRGSHRCEIRVQPDSANGGNARCLQSKGSHAGRIFPRSRVGTRIALQNRSLQACGLHDSRGAPSRRGAGALRRQLRRALRPQLLHRFASQWRCDECLRHVAHEPSGCGIVLIHVRCDIIKPIHSPVDTFLELSYQAPQARDFHASAFESSLEHRFHRSLLR